MDTVEEKSEQELQAEQESQAEQIITEALEQIDILENDLANPPVDRGPQPTLTPSGFAKPTKVLESTEVRTERIGTQIEQLKADTITKVNDTVKKLPDSDQKRIKEGTVIALYKQKDAKEENKTFSSQKDISRSQDFAMKVLANAYRDKNAPQASAKQQQTIKINVPQFSQSLGYSKGYDQQKQTVQYSKSFEISGKKVDEKQPQQNSVDKGKEAKNIDKGQEQKVHSIDKAQETKTVDAPQNETKQIEAPQAEQNSPERFMDSIGSPEQSSSMDFADNAADITLDGSGPAETAEISAPDVEPDKD